MAQTYSQMVDRLIAQVGRDTYRTNPLIRNAVALAADYGMAVAAGREHAAQRLAARYERVVAKLGYDPLT